MTISDLGSLGEFISSIAVLVTLVYLSVQVRQASRMARLTAAQENRNQRVMLFLSGRDSPFLMPIEEKLYNGEKLSFEDKRRLDNHLTATWAIQYGEWVQEQLSDVADFVQNHEFTTRLILSNPLLRHWWERRGESLYPQPFVDYVNDLMHPPTEEVSEQIRLWQLDYGQTKEAPTRANERDGSEPDDRG